MSNSAQPFNHLTEDGHLQMVNVGNKPATKRRAIAEGTVRMNAATLKAILNNTAQKGHVLASAETAGIMAAKSTANLIPLCHPLPLTAVRIAFDTDSNQASNQAPNTENAADSRAQTAALTIRATVETTHNTGVEMEALTAVSITALTIYDMVKGMDKTLAITGIHLLEKTGGQR